MVTPEYLKRLNAALALREIPDFEAALAQLHKARLSAPEQSETYLLLGLTYRDLADYDHAEANLRQAVRYAPDSHEAQQALGTLLVQRQNYSEAIRLLTPVVQSDQHNSQAAQAMATALTNEGRIEAALPILEAAFQHAPTDPNIADQYGHLLLETDAAESAVVVLTTAVELRPSPDNLCDLAAALVIQEKYTEAVRWLKQAQALQPEFDRIWRGLAYCYLHLGQIAEAQAAADRALAINNQHFRNWQTKADILLELKQSDEALTVLAQGITLARQNPAGAPVLQSLLVKRIFEIARRDGITAALARLDEDWRENPIVLDLLRIKKDFLLRQKNFTAALQALHDAKQAGVHPDQLRPDYYLVFQALNQPEQAAKVFNLDLSDADTQVGWIDFLQKTGVRLYEFGAIAAARRVIEDSLALDPHNAQSLNNLGFILVGESEWDRAEKLLIEAHALKEAPAGVTPANLGYIHLRRNELDAALEKFQEAKAAAGATDTSILRVAYWRRGAFSDTPYDRHPMRFVNTLAAICANEATVYQLQNNWTAALAAAQAAIEASPTDALGYKALGCVHLAFNSFAEARQAWEAALQRHQTRQGGEIIRQWLNELPAT